MSLILTKHSELKSRTDEMLQAAYTARNYSLIINSLYQYFTGKSRESPGDYPIFSKAKKIIPVIHTIFFPLEGV